tara:strand:+ start:7306 stop:8475 length:1170 start_codon:yes stop_codon:yes gene_type:complete
MKIIIYSTKSTFSDQSFGGAESSLTLLAEELGKLNNQVCFVTPPPLKRLSLGAIVQGNGFTVHFLPVFRMPIQRFSVFKRMSTLVNDYLCQRYMQKRFSDFDLAHCFSPQDTYRLIKWKRKNSLDLKIIIRSVGAFWKSDKRDEVHMSKVLNDTWAKADSICFIHERQSQDCLGILRQLYKIDLKDSFVQDIGIKVSKKWDWNPLNDGVFRLIMVGRFSSIFKRQDLLIHAFKKLNIHNSELIFAGDGEMKKDYEKLCFNDPFLNKRVKFIGFVETPVLRNLMSSSSLFCLASDSEGLCKSVLEAMSTGIPVLVSNVDVLNEYIIHNQNGLLAGNTIEEWSQELRSFYDRSLEERKKIGVSGKRFVEENYNSELCAKKIQDHFLRISMS